MPIPEEYKDLPVVASVSGGKDSTALCLHLKEVGIEYRAVHMDTGWEHPATDEYIREVLEPRIGPIEWIRGPLLMRELILKKGMFPSRHRRWCTEYLKILPFMAWLQDSFGTDITPISSVGIRAEESKKRAELEEWEPATYAHIWRPLINWTVQNVVDIHKRHNVTPCNLYFKPGIERLGCWPCIYARKSEIEAIARLTPDLIDEIEAMEKQVTAIANEKIEARGETPDGGQFFFGRRPGVEGIRAVVEWSKTAHGGKQYELFYDPDRSGCLRWGMCDV